MSGSSGQKTNVHAVPNEIANSGSPVAFYAGRANRSYRTVSHAEGIYFWDTNGQRYLDASSGAMVSNLGHGNARVEAAIQRQLNRVPYVVRAYFSSEPKEQLLAELINHAGRPFDQALPVSGGSEAIDTAIKLVRQYAVAIQEPARWKVLARIPSYHGATMGAAGVTGDPKISDMFGPVLRVMPKIAVPFAYRRDETMSIEEWDLMHAEYLRQAIVAEGPESVLAFLIEPVGGVSTGALVSTPAYYRRVREICDEFGVLLIFDEVISGCGRTGKFLASQYWPDATPDITVMGKGLGAGFTPIGAVLAPNRIVDRVVENGGFEHSFTYAGNPLSCAAALAVIRETIERDLPGHVSVVGEELRAGLRDIMHRSRIIGDVRGVGCQNAIEIVEDRESKLSFDPDRKITEALTEFGRSVGVQIYSRRAAGGKFGEWLMACPPLTIADHEIAEYLEHIERMVFGFEQELGFRA